MNKENIAWWICLVILIGFVFALDNYLDKDQYDQNIDEYNIYTNENK